MSNSHSREGDEAAIIPLSSINVACSMCLDSFTVTPHLFGGGCNAQYRCRNGVRHDITLKVKRENRLSATVKVREKRHVQGTVEIAQERIDGGIGDRVQVN